MARIHLEIKCQVERVEIGLVPGGARQWWKARLEAPEGHDVDRGFELHGEGKCPFEVGEALTVTIKRRIRNAWES